MDVEFLIDKLWLSVLDFVSFLLMIYFLLLTLSLTFDLENGMLMFFCHSAGMPSMFWLILVIHRIFLRKYFLILLTLFEKNLWNLSEILHLILKLFHSSFFPQTWYQDIWFFCFEISKYFQFDKSWFEWFNQIAEFSTFHWSVIFIGF